MIVVLVFTVLLLLAVVQLVLIRVRRVPRIRLSRLNRWAQFAWVAALVLMAAGPVVIGAGMVAGTFMGGGPEYVEPADFWLMIAGWLAIQGAFVLLLLGLAIAFWWPSAAALLLALTATTIPLAYAAQASILSGPHQGQAMVEAATIPIVVATFFSLPALVVALLLWSASRGLDVNKTAIGIGEHGQTDTSSLPAT